MNVHLNLTLDAAAAPRECTILCSLYAPQDSGGGVLRTSRSRARPSQCSVQYTEDPPSVGRAMRCRALTSNTLTMLTHPARAPLRRSPAVRIDRDEQISVAETLGRPHPPHRRAARWNTLLPCTNYASCAGRHAPCAVRRAPRVRHGTARPLPFPQPADLLPAQLPSRISNLPAAAPATRAVDHVRTRAPGHTRTQTKSTDAHWHSPVAGVLLHLVRFRAPGRRRIPGLPSLVSSVPHASAPLARFSCILLRARLVYWPSGGPEVSLASGQLGVQADGARREGRVPVLCLSLASHRRPAKMGEDGGGWRIGAHGSRRLGDCRTYGLDGLCARA